MSVQPDTSRLKSKLLLSGLQKTNNALYEVINELINSIGQSIAATTQTIINAVSSIAWSIITGTPTTLAGYGITDAEPSLGNPAVDGYVLSSTVLGARSWIPQAAGSSGYWTLLTDGNVDETDLIFANGEPISVFVP